MNILAFIGMCYVTGTILFLIVSICTWVSSINNQIEMAFRRIVFLEEQLKRWKQK